MQQAYNAYVTRVLEVMTTESAVPMSQAKRLCRDNLPLLESSYLNLEDTKLVAQTLMAA